MEMIFSVIGTGIAGGSMIFAAMAYYLSKKKNDKDNVKDEKADAAFMSDLRADIKYVSRQLDNVEKRLGNIETSVNGFNEKIARIETDVKAGFKQIDQLRERIVRLEQEVWRNTNHAEND